MKKFLASNMFWELIGYTNLALCVIGQITVGYWYLPAQFVYLSANVIGVVRNLKLNLPKANIVKDFAFTGITIGLIIMRIVLDSGA